MKKAKSTLCFVLALTLVLASSSFLILADDTDKEYDPETALLYDDFTTGFGNGEGKYIGMTNFILDTDGPWETDYYGEIKKSIRLNEFADGTITYYNEDFGGALFSMIARFNSGYTSADGSFQWPFNDPKVKWLTVALQRDGHRYHVYAGPDLDSMERVIPTDYTYYTEMTGYNGANDLFIEYEIESLPADTKYVRIVYNKALYSNPWDPAYDGVDWEKRTTWLDQSLQKCSRVVITNDKSKKTTAPVLTADDMTTGTEKMAMYLETPPFEIRQISNMFEGGTPGYALLRGNDDRWQSDITFCAYRVDNPENATFSFDSYYWNMGNSGSPYSWSDYAESASDPAGHLAQLKYLSDNARLQIWESPDGITYTRCENVELEYYPSTSWSWEDLLHRAVYNITGFAPDTAFIKIVSPGYGSSNVRKSDPCISNVRMTYSETPDPVNEITDINFEGSTVGSVTITSDDEYEGSVIVAVYDSDKVLKAVSVKPISKDDYVESVAVIPFGLNMTDTGITAKAFLWNDLDEIKPLVEAITR